MNERVARPQTEWAQEETRDSVTGSQAVQDCERGACQKGKQDCNGWTSAPDEHNALVGVKEGDNLGQRRWRLAVVVGGSGGGSRGVRHDFCST